MVLKLQTIFSDRTLALASLFFMCQLLHVTGAGAQVPVNDNASGAITLMVGGGCGTMYTNVNATQAPNEPLASCSDDPLNPIYTGQHIVWFKFTAPASGAVRVSTDNGGGTLHDTQIALYSATDSSDYNTFQIIACDDDNGSVNGVASILYATGLAGGQTYYVLVDGWQPVHIGTFCLTIAEIDNTMLSTTNTCTSSYPAPWGGSTGWPINPNYKGWVSLVDNSGRIVVNVRNPAGGYANSFTCGQNVNNGASRQLPSGAYYLNRNYFINNKNKTVLTKDLEVQFFFLNTEFDALNTATGGGLKLDNLNVIRQDAMCQKDFSKSIPGIELPHVGCANQYQQYIGKTATVGWATAISDVPVPGYADFYLYPAVVSPKTATICLGDSVTLQGIQTGTFNWIALPGGSTVGSLSCTTCANPVAKPDQTTQYVQLFSSGLYCSDTTTVAIAYHRDGVFIDTTICTKGSLQLHIPLDTPLGVRPDIKWSPAYYLSSDTVSDPVCSPLSSISYYVTTTVSGKCPIVDTVNVTVDDHARFIVTDTTICMHDSVQLHVPLDTTGLVKSIEWSPSSFLSNSMVSDPICFLSSSASYVVTINYANKCKTIDTFNVFVSNLAKPVATDTIICQDVISPVLQNTADSLIWYTSASDRVGTPQQPVIATSTPGYDTLYVANRCGKVPVHIQVMSKPIAALNDTTICGGTAVQLNTSGMNDVQYKWNNGDTTCCITIDEAGTYILAANNLCGNAIDSATVFDPCGTCLWAPDGFTPNGDGKNDRFRVVNNCGNGAYHIIIVNRFGGVVYESDDASQGWDGTLNGKPLDLATYYYLVTVTPRSPGIKEVKFKGNVILIR